MRTPPLTSQGQVRPPQDAEGRRPRTVTCTARALARGGGASCSLCRTSVISPFTAIRTCVPSQPLPESGYEGSHPTLDQQGTPGGPAQQPDITATGAFIMSCGSKRGGSQSTRSHFRLRVPGTECSGQTQGEWGPPGPVPCKSYHANSSAGGAG